MLFNSSSNLAANQVSPSKRHSTASPYPSTPKPGNDFLYDSDFFSRTIDFSLVTLNMLGNKLREVGVYKEELGKSNY